MTLTFSTLGCPEWSLDEILAFAKAQGIPALELRGIGPHVRMADIPELQPDQVSATKEKLQAAGVGFFCIGSSAMFHDGEKLQEAMAEGREAIDGKTYDFVIRESLEDSSQHLTYFFDGDTLFAIRATVRMDSVTMNVLFRVTAFTDEIPEDMPFEVPQGYTEYVEEPYEAPEFPSELPEFTVGTLYSVSTSAAQCGFVYIFTERTDCDAYIEALKADGFRPVAWKESGVFAASRDGILVTVSYAAGATVIACIRPSDVFLDERAGFPNVLPAFTAGTLYLAGTEDDAAIFGYLQTTQADYDAYIRLLTEAGFVRQEDEEEENLFTAVNDAGIVVIVYHLHGVTTVCCMTAQSSL